MLPTFDLGITTLPAWFTMLMVAITGSILLCHAEWIRKGRPGNVILDAGLLVMFCGIAGSRLGHVLFDGHLHEYIKLCLDPAALPGLALSAGRRCTADKQCLVAGLGDLCNPASGLCRQHRDCLRVFKIWYGGYVFYGGLILCIPVAIHFLRRRGVRVWEAGDLAGFGVPFGQAIGRIGCFLAGCCFGAPTNGPTGIAFPRYSPAWRSQLEQHLIDASAATSLPVHPTQLYEALACAVICALGVRRYRRGRHFRGELFFQYVLLYGLFRIAVEFVRADERGLWLGGLASTSQLLSLPMIAWALWVLWRRRAWPLDDDASVAFGPTAGRAEGQGDRPD